ncbi:MAG: type III-A CRISPR-associated RAMP protein Csm5, partial [Desulfurobacteriaceae bacterium]
MVELRPVEYRVTLTVKTPLAVTTGESYQLTDYALKDGLFFLIDSDAFASYLMKVGKFQEFINLISSAGRSLKTLRAFIDSVFESGFDELVKSSREVECDSEALRALRESEGKNEIRKIYRNPIDGEPYIPGSTVKGAVRNALESKILVDALKNLDVEDLPYLFEELNALIEKNNEGEEVLEGLSMLCSKLKSILRNEVFCDFKKADKEKKKRDKKGRGLGDKDVVRIFDHLVDLTLRKRFRKEIFAVLKKSSKKPSPTAGDLMRFVKVSDFRMVKGEVRVGLPKNSKMEKGPKVFTEYVAPGSEFVGTITVYEDVEELFPSSELTMESLIKALRFHSSRVFSVEKKKGL